ncbi:hypothetical protein S40285_09176 [Stachybotrys chlorohalonatus IBT 40285]|uniref:Major facilitator superfamily (MFS) profile domain-containing protein n=1 Tax=Stachybotrys chlorohalonatus (strain IBT 40285) TaxID=1283841 RepID=A0A084Q932_STAC4|nr:hypothetical protein S40285_09176 [Stachybotrys chlorohalonata IBT 40285]
MATEHQLFFHDTIGEATVKVQRDESESESTSQKLADDGKTILIPQPSGDPDDPLNWSSFKKHMILITVSFGAAVGEFGMAAGIPAIVLHSQEWDLPIIEANYPNNIAVVMVGCSAILWVPLTNCWGRAPVFLWSTVMGLMFTLGCLLTRDWATFYAMRALQAATQAIGSVVGLIIIHDLFFFHEHARKIGIWCAFFLTAPFAGPLFGNFMIAGLGEWRPVFWLVFATAATVLAMTVLFFDETKYVRSVPLDKQPQRGKGFPARMVRLVGIWQLQNREGYLDGVLESYWRQVEVVLRPIVPVTVILYGVIFMWCVGINQSSAILLETPRELGGYGLSPRAIGYIYFTPVVATFMGEAFGHFYNDYLVRRHAARHHGSFVPEVRLWATYPMAIIMIPGLVLVGQTLENHLHLVGIIFGWGAYQMGIMVVSVAMVAFIYDSYPGRAGEVSALINCGRGLLGFAVGYYQQDWGLRQGFDVSFGLQAVVTAVCFGAIFCVHRWGRYLK